MMLLKYAREEFVKDIPFHHLPLVPGEVLPDRIAQRKGKFSEIEIGYFGRARAYGNFTQIVYGNATDNQLQVLGEGLDHIPIEGVVYREDYLMYVEALKRALKGKPQGLGVGARLLTIKRPDTFTPWNNVNKRTLESLLKLKPRLKPQDYERYWDEVIFPYENLHGTTLQNLK